MARPTTFITSSCALIRACCAGSVLTACLFGQVVAHEWSDSTGTYKVTGDLIAMDETEIVIKLEKPTKGHELLAFPIDKLSDADRKYLESTELTQKLSESDKSHAWTMRNGFKLFGKIVDFAKKDVTVQRRRGRVYVNDRPMENLPELYRRMIPKIVEEYENIKFEDDRAFLTWVTKLKAAPKTYHCEGVLLELANGDEYAFPFFMFSESDQNMLKPAWTQWESTHTAQQEQASQQEQQRQNSLYLQSQAAAYQQQQAEAMQISRLQLQVSAVNAGLTSIWEVYLYPPAGSYAYPMSVVVSARNSDFASQIAMQNNPGYTAGPVRKVSGL